jgi:hypothetical protein
MSNVVALLVATFDFCLDRFPRGVPLYTLEDFYMGPASLKTSPLLGVSPHEEKSTGPKMNFLETKTKKGEKRRMRGLRLYFAEATHLQFKYKMYASYQCSNCELRFCL